jgi:hypothetical protein
VMQLKILSLGWGVQSFTIAAMSALGEIEPFDYAIHSDTTFESEATYNFRAKWEPWLTERGVNIITVTDPKATQAIFNEPDKGNVFVPAYFLNDDVTPSRRGQLNRSCTDRWKIRPLRKKVTQLLKERKISKKPGVVQQWLGISMDERQRMNTSDVQFVVNRFPLIEKRMSRNDCINWLGRNGLEVPHKSACVFCPYSNKARWNSLKRAGGKDWAVAQQFDNAIRKVGTRKRLLFVHPGLKSLDAAIDPQLNFDDLLSGPVDGIACSTAGYCWS